MIGRVATVAGTPIPVSVLEDRIELLRRGPRGRHIPPLGTPGYSDASRWVVRELVTEAILAHEARTHGLTDLSQLVMAVTEGLVVSDEEIRSYYDRNADLFGERADGHPVRGCPPVDRAGAPDELRGCGRSTCGSIGDGQELAVVEPGYEHPADPSLSFPSHRH